MKHVWTFLKNWDKWAAFVLRLVSHGKGDVRVRYGGGAAEWWRSSAAGEKCITSNTSLESGTATLHSEEEQSKKQELVESIRRGFSLKGFKQIVMHPTLNDCDFSQFNITSEWWGVNFGF